MGKLLTPAAGRMGNEARRSRNAVRDRASTPIGQPRWPASKIPPLLRERAFRRYWSGQTISMFGDQISSIVLPLVAVLTLHVGPAQMGYLAGLVWLPSLLFGLHAGAWVDRRGRRRTTMITADLGRAVLLASIPVCYAAGVLTLGQLYGVAFGTGALSVLFTVSDPALFVALVPEGRYVEGQSLVYGSRALSFVGGPSVGGLLVQLLTAPFAVIATRCPFSARRSSSAASAQRRRQPKAQARAQ
jgi:MFS family permease